MSSPVQRLAVSMLRDASRPDAPRPARTPRLAVLRRLATQPARRLGWGIADQAISSVTNFAVVFLVARSLGAVQFGAFSLAYVAYGFALNLSRGLASYPLQVRYSGAEIGKWRKAVAESSGTALVTGVATGIIVLAVASALNGDSRAAFTALGLTLPGLLLQDSWRYAFFVLGRGSQAFLNDAVWAAVQIPTMLLLLRTPSYHHVFWFVMAWGAAAAVASAVGPLQAKVLPNLEGVSRWMTQHLDLGARYAASNLVNSIATQARSSVIAGVLGLAVVGYVQAAGTLMGPFMVVFYGIGLVTVPEAVRVLHRSPRRLPLFCVTVAVGLGTAALAWGGLLLVALPHGLGNLMLGSIWRPTYVLVLPQTLAIVGQAFSSGAATGMGALGAANRALRAAVIASIAFLICGVLGPVLGGAIGTMIGAMISAWIGALAFWWELRGAMREHAIVTVGRRRGTYNQSGRHRRSTQAGAPVRLSDGLDRQAPVGDQPLCSAAGQQNEIGSLMKISSANSKRLISVISGCVLLAAAFGFWVVSHSSKSTYTAGLSAGSAPDAGAAARSAQASGGKVCGQPILRSPYNYHGKPGSFRSGTRGLPTFGKAGTTFPSATAGVILPAGTHDYPSYKLRPNTVYYLLPGTHVTTIQANVKDAFVGGYWKGAGTILNGEYANGGQAIDSNETLGNQRGVTVEYLTIERYLPDGNAAAINQEANSGWLVQFNTITLNVPGAGVMLGTANVLRDNCLTLNGQYGFQSTATDGYDRDAVTGGPYGIKVTGNEISYNDTCDYSGLLNNKAAGWSNYDPVPAKYRNSRCGSVTPDGDQGGFKLWQTNAVTIADNYIHNNWGPGGWADTDNANTTWSNNTITDNEGEGIIEEISYNFGITDNYIADNDWIDGLNNPGFPQAAIYVSESGSDTTFGGVPACGEASCKGMRSYVHQSPISGNTFVNNGGSVFLWQSSNRFCSDGFDAPCTLVDDAPRGPFTVANCKANLPTAAVNLSTFQGEMTGSPAENWWDGCKWTTANVAVTGNTFDFNPALIPHCDASAWPDCGAGGMFSQYTTATSRNPGWVVPTQLTFFQNNVWSHNKYNGPLRIFAWNQGNGDNPVTWSDWTLQESIGNKCALAGERQSGYCSGPFGQDAGSTYHPAPVS